MLFYSPVQTNTLHWSCDTSLKGEHLGDRYKLYALQFQAQEIKHLHSLCKLSPLTDRSLTHRLAAQPIPDAISCCAIYVSPNSCVHPIDSNHL